LIHDRIPQEKLEVFREVIAQIQGIIQTDDIKRNLNAGEKL
jgi:hypothetical protein